MSPTPRRPPATRRDNADTMAGIGRAFSSLVALQALTRLVNFALTTALARRLGPAAIGLANVQMQLVSASALFLAKEGLRRACQRVYPGGAGAALAHGVNLAWLSVPITALCAAGVEGSLDADEQSHSLCKGKCEHVRRSCSTVLTCNKVQVDVDEVCPDTCGFCNTTRAVGTVLPTPAAAMAVASSGGT